MVLGVGKKSEIRLKSEDSVPWSYLWTRKTLGNMTGRNTTWGVFIAYVSWRRNIYNWIASNDFSTTERGKCCLNLASKQNIMYIVAKLMYWMWPNCILWQVHINT